MEKCPGSGQKGKPLRGKDPTYVVCPECGKNVSHVKEPLKVRSHPKGK